MIKVKIRPGEPKERFLQRFKRICSKEGVFREARRRRYYEKPSDRKRRRAKEAKRALRKALRMKTVRGREDRGRNDGGRNDRSQ